MLNKIQYTMQFTSIISGFLYFNVDTVPGLKIWNQSDQESNLRIFLQDYERTHAYKK